MSDLEASGLGVRSPSGPPGIRASTLHAGDAALDCHVVPWDTAIFGFPVAAVTRLDLGTPGSSSSQLLAAFDEWCALHAIRLASCRLDHLQLRESMELEAHGFRFIEMVYEPTRALADRFGAPQHPVRIREAGENDLPAIEAIAANAFSTGRFLLDHRLPPHLSHSRYRAWVRSSFEGGVQTVLAADLDGALVGFFVVEQRPGASVYWHLTAIAPGWQGRGVGLSVWRAMLLRHAAEGAATVETTISAHNLAVLNLYARLGFSFPSARMTFHRLMAPSA